MTDDWRKVDHRGNWLAVEGRPCDGLDPCVSIEGYHLHASMLPEFIAALYAAAGKPEPVILDRPLGHYSDAVSVFADGAKVRLQAPESHSAKEHWRTDLTPEDARKLAAGIATLADFIDRQPGLAEVEELAAAIAAERGGYECPHDLDRELARAALRWMREREASSNG